MRTKNPAAVRQYFDNDGKQRHRQLMKAREDIRSYLLESNSISHLKVLTLKQLALRGDQVQQQCRVLIYEAIARLILQSKPIFLGAREMLLLENPAMVPPLDFLHQQVDMFVDALRRHE